MENINIPIYRAKEIDSDDYIEGNLVEDEGIFYIIKNPVVTHFHGLQRLTGESEYLYRIDATTLAIHFPDMIDSQGNKIFASLSEKGGSLLQYEGTIYEVMYLNYLIQGVTNMHSIKSELFEYAKVIGIQE